MKKLKKDEARTSLIRNGPARTRQDPQKKSAVGKISAKTHGAVLTQFLLERTSDNIQLKVDDERNHDAIHDAAASGLEGASSQLPHLDPIQRSFGGFDVTGVSSYVGGRAKEACRSMGAIAYASGNNVAFKTSPDLHTAAHEAAHVIQQRAGVSLTGGVGRVGDPYESNADEVADAVVQGRSAVSLLSATTGHTISPDKADRAVGVQFIKGPDETGGGSTSGSSAGPNGSDSLDELETLLGDETTRLTPEQIARARALISLQPEERQATFWTQLQGRVEYANQRDNDAKWRNDSPAADDMCNLTSLGMCLQYLGVSKPTDYVLPPGISFPEGKTAATLQYEDALFYYWRSLGGPGKITSYSSWRPMMDELGITHETVNFSGTRAEWDEMQARHLGKGHGVMVGGFGHIVRVQSVNDAGIVVDDPYGGSTAPKKSWPNGKNKNQKESAAGEDCDWPCPEGAQTLGVKWYFAIQP